MKIFSDMSSALTKQYYYYYYYIP